MAVWTFALGAALTMQQGTPLTLDEALKLAEQSAFSLKVSNSNVKKAEARAREAKSSTGGRISVDGTYTRFDKELTSSFGSTSIVTRPIDQTTAKVTFSYPIDITGILGRVVESARLFYFASQDQYQADRNQLRLDVRQAYFNVLRAQEQVAVFEGALKGNQDRLELVKKQLAVGQIARVDVLRVETQVAQSKSDLLAAENSLQLAKNLFNNVLGRPIDTTFNLAPINQLPTVDSEDTNLATVAVANRAEVKGLRKQLKGYENLTKSAKSGLSPSLNFSLQYNRDFEAAGFSSQSQSTVGVLALSVPLYDAGTTKAKVDQARQDEEVIRIRLQQTELGISLEVRQATTNYRNAMARLNLAESQVKSAEENYRLAVLKTDNGEGINLEVVDAQTQLTAAKAQVVSARYDVHIAFAQLQKAVGLDDPAKGASKEGQK